MAEADLSKIVGMIMENPELVEKIREMGRSADGDGKESEPSMSEELDAVHEEPARTSTVSCNSFSEPNSRRSELLKALGAFLSDERRRALESMISVANVLDTMRTK